LVRHTNAGSPRLCDTWTKRAVRVLRRAEITQARVRLGREAFQQGGREPRLKVLVERLSSAGAEITDKSGHPEEEVPIRRVASASSMKPARTPGLPDGGELFAHARTTPASLTTWPEALPERRSMGLNHPPHWDALGEMIAQS
jgi:hypothetical protein